MTVAPASGGVPITVAGDRRITRAGAVCHQNKARRTRAVDRRAARHHESGPAPEVPRYVAHYPAEWRDASLLGAPRHHRLRLAEATATRNDLLAARPTTRREYIDVILPPSCAVRCTTSTAPASPTTRACSALTLRTVFVPPFRRPRGTLGMNDRKLCPGSTRRCRRSADAQPRHRDGGGCAGHPAGWQLMYLFRLGFERWQPGRPPSTTTRWRPAWRCATWIFLAVTGVPRAGHLALLRLRRLQAHRAGLHPRRYDQRGGGADGAAQRRGACGASAAPVLLHPDAEPAAHGLPHGLGQARSVASRWSTAKHAVPSCSVPARRRGGWWRHPSPRRLDGAGAARRRPRQSGACASAA